MYELKKALEIIGSLSLEIPPYPSLKPPKNEIENIQRAMRTIKQAFFDIKKEFRAWHPNCPADNEHVRRIRKIIGDFYE